MDLFTSGSLIVAILCFFGPIQAFPMEFVSDMLPSSNQGFHLGHSHNKDDDDGWEKTVAIAGKSATNENSTSFGLHQLGYASVGRGSNDIGDEGKLEVGLYKYSDSSVNATVLSSGPEIGIGAIGRINLVNADVSLGKVGVNTGVNLDTGLIVKDNGVELKVIGIGVKLGKNVMQVCFWFCIGVTYYTDK